MFRFAVFATALREHDNAEEHVLLHDTHENLHFADTTHGTAIYADQVFPLAPPQLIGIYGSPMECLGLGIVLA